MTDGQADKINLQKLRWKGVREHQPFIGPHTVHFDIANGCNVRCTTCWHHSPHLLPVHAPSSAWKRKQMEYSTFCKIMDDLVELQGLQQIILSGMGDPSLNSSLIDMVEYAHRHHVGVTIITNLLQVDLPRLLSSPLSRTDGMLNLLVSVCGVTSDVWNAFHSASSGFDKLLGQLDILKQANFLPKHVQVINSQNYHELDQMVRFAKTWPAKRINFKYASLKNGTESIALSPQEKRELKLELIPRAQAVAAFNEIDTDLVAFNSQISDDDFRTAPMETVGCYMGTVYCRITVDLELLYCCNTEVSVGFLDQEHSFRALWLSDRYRELREKLARKDFFESCQQCGKFKQNLKWSQKIGALRAKGLVSTYTFDEAEYE